MKTSGGGIGLFLIAAALVGLPMGPGLVLIGMSAWTFATSNANFDHQVATVMGVFGLVACAPAAIWALISTPWMRRRIAAGEKGDVVMGLASLGFAAIVGVGLTLTFLLAP